MSGYERKGPKLVCVRAQCWAGARTGTNETENSGEKVVAAAGRAAAGTGGGGTGPASQDAAQSSDAAPIQL